MKNLLKHYKLLSLLLVGLLTISCSDDDDSTATNPTDCLMPTALTVDDITTTTATVSWTANSSEMTWEYQVVESEVVPTETGTVTTENPLVLTDLTDNTDYDVYVRANCGSDETSEWGMVSFTTLQPTIVDIAIATPDLSNLVAALQAADGDLVSVLSEGEFTVLAPTNAAFESFLSANGFASLDDVPTDVLSNILLNHVITGEVRSSDLAALGAGYSSTNATNADGDNLSLYFNTTDGVVFNGVSSVATADVEASNGVVHVVDAVIGLPTVVTFATADPTFETLVAALTREDHEEDFVSLLSSSEEPAPYTVFAPTNAAFGDLLSLLELSALADIEIGLLEDVLGMHVILNANVRSGDLTEGMVVETATEENITISLESGAKITDPNGFESNIIVVDVQAMNGVVHAIDKVILPSLP